MQIAPEQEGEWFDRIAIRRGSEGVASHRLASRVREGDDHVLVQRAKLGDRDAFDRLRARHADALRATLARRVRESEVDDLAQDTWLSAWCALGRFDGASHFRTWLIAIALHKLGSHFRRGEQSRSTLEYPGSEAIYVERAFERSALREVLGQAFAAMSGPQREVLDLYYFDDLNLREISERLGRNLNTVKYQFYRGHAEAAIRLADALGVAVPPTGEGTAHGWKKTEFRRPPNLGRGGRD